MTRLANAKKSNDVSLLFDVRGLTMAYIKTELQYLHSHWSMIVNIDGPQAVSGQRSAPPISSIRHPSLHLLQLIISFLYHTDESPGPSLSSYYTESQANSRHSATSGTTFSHSGNLLLMAPSAVALALFPRTDFGKSLAVQAEGGRIHLMSDGRENCDLFMILSVF